MVNWAVVRCRAGVGGSLALCVGLSAGCTRPPSNDPDAGPLRLAIASDAYGAHPTHVDALHLGERLELSGLELADGGDFELDEALGAGPVVFVWVGGAEHEALMAWVGGLELALPALEAHGATLVWVRPLAPEAALRWAFELRLQAPVVSDVEASFGAALDLGRVPDRGASTADFAVLIVGPEGRLRYRKIGGRRPGADEIEWVLAGEAEAFACCPGACVGSACERIPGSAAP